MKANDAQILLTGFGPFGAIQHNPSSVLLKDLQRYLQYYGIKVKIISLPVSYLKAPEIIDIFLENEKGLKFDLILGMGLHRSSDFRLETTARPYPVSAAADIHGDTGNVYKPASSQQLCTGLPIDLIINALTQTWPWIRRSDNASGYVCEAVYHHLLHHSYKMRTLCGFIHIPAFKFCHRDLQIFLMNKLIQSLLNADKLLDLTKNKRIKE